MEHLDVTQQVERELKLLLTTPSEDFEFIDSQDMIPCNSADEWGEAALSALSSLYNAVENVPGDSVADSCGILHTPTLGELVEKEASRHVIGGEPISSLKRIDELEDERKRLVNGSLTSVKLAEYFEKSDNIEIIKDIKFQFPHVNQITRSAYAGQAADVPVAAFQVYKEINHRTTKLFEIEIPLSGTVLELFQTIVDMMPEPRMFDGPNYAGSGMVIIGSTMYVTGSEDYSVPYRVWLDQFSIPYTVHPMGDQSVGGIPDLISVASESIGCFLIYNGNETLLLFLSNFTCRPADANFPVTTYKRRIPKVARCVLCLTRAADLIVINDEVLPRNPSHGCNQCYRRLRSDRAGNFIPPGEDVIVSTFSAV